MSLPAVVGQELKSFKIITTYDPSDINEHEETPVAALLESLITAEDTRILDEVNKQTKRKAEIK